ncbi:cell wall metabolism sensor histidine kinase WalK [Roseovarius sp. MMSF_3350]|uniref:sensor histidine kinase n=2 Tax=unclassified Roseovarius TaxID=2614913 RepID=UPI00273F6260|nr:PAS domain-containing sensor histidine kinase [Roseovarius sp. MMSF_3350]
MQPIAHPQKGDNIGAPRPDEAAMTNLSFLETILESLQDGVYVYASDTLRIRYMNEAARARHGWTRQETRKKRISDTAATFNTKSFFRAAAPLLSGEQSVITLELVHFTGPIEVSTRMVRTADEGDFFVSILRDISDRKCSQFEKVQTVSTVSHELRTPLTSIHGALRLLKAGAVAELDPKTQNVVDIAARNTDRLLSIVNDILDLEKINSNKMDFSIAEMDVVSCVNDTVEMIAGAALENDVRLDVGSDLRNAMVLGNPERISQVITNFTSNAIKYSPKGAPVRIGITQTEDGIVISVTDHGPGISEDQNRMLFKPFSQARAGDGSKRPGTGLGLAIVAAIAERLDYPVDFRSVVGQGSTFQFRIPSHLVLWTDPHDTADAAAG